MAVMKRFCNLFRNHLFCLTLLSFLLAVGVSIFLYYIIELNINENASYYTLSSIFQGLFAILAFAGILVISKTDQLSRDNAKYDSDNKAFLDSLFHFSSDMKSKTLFYSTPFEFMQLRDYFDILESLDKRRPDIKHKLENIMQKLDELKKIALGGWNSENLSNDELKELIGNSERIIHLIEEKQDLIHKNESFKHEIIKSFKLPFINGMLLIILAIYFLPLINSNSNLGFDIPITIIIGTSVILTIIVVLEIMCVIYYTFWSEIAKRTL